MMKVILIWKWLAEFLFTHLPWNKPPPITPFDVLLCVSNSHSVGTTHVSHRLLGITFGERLGAFKIGYATFFLSLTASSLFMHIHYKKKTKHLWYSAPTYGGWREEWRLKIYKKRWACMWEIMKMLKCFCQPSVTILWHSSISGGCGHVRDAKCVRSD